MGQPKRVIAAAGLTALLALLFLAGAAPARAQTGPSPGQVKTELERTDALLARAGQEASEVRNAFTQERLRKALDIQRQAWGEFRRGTGAGLKSAQTLTRNARSLALQAIEAAGIEKRARETIRTMIEEAQHRASEISPVVSASQNPLAQKLLEQGLHQLRRARRAFQGGNPQAGRLATLARNLIDRAGRVATGLGAAISEAETSIDRAEALLAEVEARLAEEGPDAAVRALLAEALDLLAQARRALGEGHPGRAFRLSASAREKGLRALSGMRRVPDGEALMSTLEDMETLYAEMAPRIEESGPQQARNLLDQGRELLGKARRSLGEGDPAQALAALAASQALLRDAAEAAGLE